MKKLLIIAVTMLSAGSFTACKGKDITADVAKFAEQACACKDAECAKKVLGDFQTFAKANKGASGDKEKAAESAKKMGMCLIKAGVSMKELQTAMQSLK